MPATHFTPGQNDCNQRPGKSTSTGPGAFRPPGQRGNRGSRSSAAAQRLLFNIFPRAEKDRRVSPHFRSQGSQSVSESTAFSHAHHSRGSPDCCERRVVHVNRSDGCVLSCPYCGRAPPLPQVCLSGSPLAVQGPSFRAFPFPEGVYSVHKSGPFSSAGQRHENSAVSRRLASVRPNSNAGNSEYMSSSFSSVPIGASSQFDKEFINSISDDDLFGSRPGLHFDDCSPIQSQGRGHPQGGQSFQTRQAVPLCRLSTTVGQTDVGHSHSAPWLAGAEASTEVAQQVSPGSQTPQTSYSCGNMGLSSHSGTMEGQGLFVKGGPYGVGGVPQRGGHYRRQLHRMGSCLATQSCSGTLVSAGSHPAHKCSRAAGCAFGSEALYVPFGGAECFNTDRQHLCRLSYQSPRRHQIGTAPESVQRSAGMGLSSSVHPSGSVFAGRVQSGRGCSFSPGTCSGRMVSTQRRGAQDLGHLRSGTGRSVRFDGIDPLSSMVLPVGVVRRTRAGCTGSSLASGPPVRFPTSSSDLANPSESSQGGPQIVTGGALLARTTLVSSAAQVVLRHSVASSRQEGSALTVARSSLAPESSTSPAVCVAIGRPELQLTELSDPVRQTILSARASSTRRQYENRWRLFSRWCSGHDEDPVSCSVPTILNFLQSLLDEGRSPSTIKVYVAAISCYHTRIDGCTVGSHNLVSLFLRGARRLHPRSVPRAPVWDLPLVLDALCSPPFEPLAQADLKWLSCKTAFLLAIVSAKRVSELHALSVSPSCLRWHPDGSGVTLWPNTAFVPKVVSRVHSNRPLTLARFQPQSGAPGQASELLCPVRALEAYVAATAGMRRSDQLFLCYGGPKVGCPLSKQRLSHWIVDVICHAYRAGGHSLPVGLRAHSTRSVSTSWAVMRGVSLETICAAASWVSPTTFTRFYNVNVAAPHPLSGVLLQGSSGLSH